MDHGPRGLGPKNHEKEMFLRTWKGRASKFYAWGTARRLRRGRLGQGQVCFQEKWDLVGAPSWNCVFMFVGTVGLAPSTHNAWRWRVPANALTMCREMPDSICLQRQRHWFLPCFVLFGFSVASILPASHAASVFLFSTQRVDCIQNCHLILPPKDCNITTPSTHVKDRFVGVRQRCAKSCYCTTLLHMTPRQIVFYWGFSP